MKFFWGQTRHALSLQHAPFKSRRICSKPHFTREQKLGRKNEQKAYARSGHEFDEKSQNASKG
jgi:hypothetical protein